MSGAAWVAVALAALFAVQAWAPSAEAQARSGVAPPPGDCWGGALSEDPLHCYILEETQRAGLIEVAAVYLSPGTAVLYIYLEQTEPLSAAVGAYFRDKAHEYMTSSEGRSGYGREYMTLVNRYRGVELCDRYKGDERKICLDYLLYYPDWEYFDSLYQVGLPYSSAYTLILLDVGGADARRSRPGWASWSQLWPVVAGSGQSSSASASTGFDVSDVEVTNFPKPDCENNYFHGPLNPSCYVWSLGSEPGFAGTYADEGKKVIYVQLTTAIPVDETELEALKQRVAPGYQILDYRVEFVPVRYNFGQLWRWSVILDRFALSAANTIGIEKGRVRTNIGDNDSSADPELMWLNGVRPSGGDYTWNWPAVRNILAVDALIPSVAIEAFPRLLPALGIPLDAVGLVRPADYTPFGPIEPLPGIQPTSPPAQGVETTERAPPPELDCDDDSGAPLLSFCDAW